MIVVTFDKRGQPTSVELDGKAIFVQSMDVQYRPNQPAKLVLDMYLADNEGILDRYQDGEPIVERRVLYAVSKEDHDLLMQLKQDKG